MQGASEIETQQRNPRGLLLRLFLELSLGAIAILALATIAAPRLFDLHNDPALIASILVWLSCPVLLYLLGADAARLWRRIKGDSRE
jgi:hypothetical protein